MNQFEVPYNFRADFIPLLKQQKNLIPYIKFFYLPCFSNEEALCTRQDLYIFHNLFPKTWEDYIKHIKKLQEIAPVAILMQRGNISLNTIEKYYSIGVRKFILSDERLAQILKKQYNNIIIILTLTRCLSFEDFFSLDLTMYDEIVLPFNFCRQLQLIEQLPKKYNYSILVNSVCYYKCSQCQNHWFMKANSEEEFIEKTTKLLESYCHSPYFTHNNERIKIEPSDLKYFEPYVQTFKLVDRIDTSEEIINHLKEYVNNYNNPVIHSRDYYCLG